MAYSLLQMGESMKTGGMSGLRDAAQLDQQREMKNKELEQQKKAGEMQSVGTGAMSGAMIGAKMGSAGGPWGALIGAGVGALSGWLMS